MNRHQSESQLLRYADYRAIGRDDNEIARQLKRDDIVRIVPGVYAPSDLWRASYPEAKHKLRVHAQHGRLSSPVFALYSAAAVHEISLLGPWPDAVHVTENRDPKRGNRSSGCVVRHQASLDDDDMMIVDGMAVTTPARTAYDLACELSFVDGVAMIDSVRNRRHPLAGLAELTHAFESGRKLAGRPKALQALAFSTDLSESVQESRSRVLIHELGFPPPELQVTMTCDGHTYRGDFWWQRYRHWAEFDGTGKYLSPEYQRGRSANEIVVAEKRREDAIRRRVDAFSRWEKRDLDDPRRLYRILASQGLPSEGRRMLPR